MTAAIEDRGLSELIGRLTKLAGSGENKVSIHEIREEIGERSFGPFLIIPSIIEISPIGGIPGLPTIIALIISLFSVQILFGRKHLWLPDWLERRRLDAGKLQKGLRAIGPVARFTDKVIRPRLSWATKPPWLQGVAGITILLAATVPPLELIPFASTVPMAAIALFGLSLLARDGLVACIASLIALGAIYLVYGVITG